MIGNVWVWNHASEAGSREATGPRRAAVVPISALGADRDARLTMQGGCYLARLTHANLYSRMAHPATDGACDIGFRLVAVRPEESGVATARR